MNRKDQEIKAILKELHKIAQILLEEGAEREDDILNKIGATIQLMLVSVAKDDFEEMMHYVGMFVRAKSEQERAVSELLKGINLN